MSDAPAPPALLATALVRQVQAAGGFAAFLARGSDIASGLLIVLRQPGSPSVTVHERLPSATGGTSWRRAASGEDAVAGFLARQRRFDPDLWVIELDIADPQRFIPGFDPGD